MDVKTIQQIKDALLEKSRLYGRSGEFHVDEIADAVEPHAEIVDIAQSQEQLDRDNSLKEVERRELVLVERALDKLTSGQFGVCEDCGDEILEKRLMIVPEARLCATCQAYQERQEFRTRPLRTATR